MTDINRILSATEQGDSRAAQELLPLIYGELRRLAAQKLANEKPGQTLQATALVHEVFIRLVDTSRPQQWNSRGHFFAAAAEAMRRILIDHARHKRTLKSGGKAQRIPLADVELAIPELNIDLLALDDALEKLAAKDPRKALLVKLRFFAGLSADEAAEALGVAVSTANADWAYAKHWLRLAMADDTPLS